MNRQSWHYVHLRILAGVVFATTLAACGGCDDSSPELVSAAPTPMPAAPAIISGTAAVGAALAGANVTVTNGTPEQVSLTCSRMERQVGMSPSWLYQCGSSSSNAVPRVPESHGGTRDDVPDLYELD